MTTETVPLAIRLHNPGALRAYWGMDYNDGYERGLAKFRNPRDGWVSLLNAIHHTYVRRNKKTWFDFATEWYSDDRTSSLLKMRSVMHIMRRDNEDPTKDEVRAHTTLGALNLAMALSIVESGRPPMAWPTGKWWVDLNDLIRFQEEDGW